MMQTNADSDCKVLHAIIYFNKWKDDNLIRNLRINLLSGDSEYIIYDHKFSI